jgi:hypothetical protein
VGKDSQDKKDLKKARKKAAFEHRVQSAAHEAHEAHEAFCREFERLQVDARAELAAMLADLRSACNDAVDELIADRDRAQRRLAEINTEADGYLATIQSTGAVAETAARELESRSREYLEQTDQSSRDSLTRLEATFAELRESAEAGATTTAELIETAATEAEARVVTTAERIEAAATEAEARVATTADRVESAATETEARLATTADRVETAASDAEARVTVATTAAVEQVETAATQSEATATSASERIEHAVTRHEQRLDRIFTEFTTRLAASELETAEYVGAARERTAGELAELTVGVDRNVQDLQTFARTRIGEALAQVESESQALLSKAEAAVDEIPTPAAATDEPTSTYFVEHDLIGSDPIDTNPIAWGPADYEPLANGSVDFEPVGFEPVDFEPVGFAPVDFEPVGFEPVGLEPVEEEPVAFHPVGFEPVGFEPVAFEPVDQADAGEVPEDDAPRPDLDDDPVFNELVAGMRGEQGRAGPDSYEYSPADGVDDSWAITSASFDTTTFDTTSFDTTSFDTNSLDTASFDDASSPTPSGSFEPSPASPGGALEEHLGVGAVDVIATRPVNVTVSLREVGACALQLTRTAGQVVRIAVVHSLSQGTRESALRLTTSDTVGWWEYEDVPAVTDNDAKASAVVDLAELRDALDAHDRFVGGSDAPIRIEHNVVIGNHLILARDATELPGLSDDRKIIERVDLRATDRRGLILETQVGRLLLPLDLVAQFRARQIAVADLVLVNGLPCLSAEVTGSGATGPRHFLARLQEFDEFDVPVESERRGPTGSEVSQLISALSPTTTPEELERILKVGVGYTRRRAAAHPALRQELILDLVREGTEAIRAAAASNTSLEREACDLAVGDSSSLVRAMAAANPAIPTPALEQLATDSAAQVRSHAASNPMIPDELLLRLAEDEESSVRASVAAHPKVDIETLLVLARDPDPLVCEAVANNPACPAEALQELVGIVPDLVLSNPKASEALLVAGSQVDSPRLRMMVARNPATPAKQLRRLARDPDLDVLAAVAEHPKTPASARRRARRSLNPASDEAREA